MEQTLWVLVGTAVTLGFVHTLVGIDHSLPFIVIGRAQQWSATKVAAVTTLCGVGHVVSSVLLGFAGIALGMAVGRLEWIESSRGELAAWLLIGFGLAYASWAFYHSLRKRSHRHEHVHEKVGTHSHLHSHEQEHMHPHRLDRRGLTLWTLFIIFVFGPCEPLIPLLMVPAFQHNWSGVALVALVFGVTTIATMVVVVLLGYHGLRVLSSPLLERHSHALAGLTIAASGVAVKFLGI